ncbi:MAG: TolC family outer membrane protein [Nitrosomonadales bacterium]|nr:TolC family outer membrane protein [Nitrosomonadales bacterium]
MQHVFRKSAISLALGLAIAGAQAAPVTLNEVASKAVLTNPEVTAKWNEFKASLYERDITWGRYLPALDVLYGTAYQKRESPLYTPPASEHSFNFQTSKITLSQNLFEGFATQNDTKRLEHASMVRFYEMLDASESAALDAATAYIDVWRHRQLVEFAQESYVTHRLAYTKVKERAQSGVGRQVDFETATGRLALAEANLLTETANLHDVSARYQRIVGELPKIEMEGPSAAILAQDLPKGRVESINLGFEKSPLLKAAFENILSAKRNVEVQKSGFYPRIDAYLEGVHDKTADALYPGSTVQKTAGLTVSWNLFRGNQDKSKKLKAAEEVNIAKDLREKVCREVRQNLAMSFNDHLRLIEQLQYQDQHQLSTDKVREAFRNQYDIGQRTLLDVLDIENEYYTARRDYLNSEMDLMIADAKYQAASGNLLNVLKLKNLDMTPPKPVTTPDDDMFTTCPAEAIDVVQTDKDGIFNSALEKDRLSRVSATPPAPPPPPAVITPVTVKQVIKTAKPVIITGANFFFDSAQLKSSAGAKLRLVIEFANKHPGAGIEVIGYTDDLASDAYNQSLSERRAESVKDWLVTNGVDAKRITTRGMGKSQPIASNETKEGRAQNRRAEVHYTVLEEQ